MASRALHMRCLCLLVLAQSATRHLAHGYLVPTPAPPRLTNTSLCIITVVGTVGEYNISGDGGDAASALLLLPDRVSASRAGDIYWVVRGARRAARPRRGAMARASCRASRAASRRRRRRLPPPSPPPAAAPRRKM